MVPGRHLLVCMGAVAMALQSRKISGLIRSKHWLPNDKVPLTKHLSGISAGPCPAFHGHIRVPRAQLGKGIQETQGGLSAGPLLDFLAGKRVCCRDVAHLPVSFLSSISFAQWFVASSDSRGKNGPRISVSDSPHIYLHGKQRFCKQCCRTPPSPCNGATWLLK